MGDCVEALEVVDADGVPLPGDLPAVRSLPPLDRLGVVGIATVKLAFHLATADLYGLHRDEFYYLAAGRHLAFGYVDQPPLTPLLYRGWSALFGASQYSLHSLAALLSVPMVVLAALLARELGGGRSAQRMAMTVAATGTVFATTFHFVSTVTLDLLFWAAATWLVVRLMRTGNVRLWVPIGAVVGLGFENKHTIVFWMIATAAGLLLTPQRRLLFTPWLAAGLLIAAVLAAPNVAWQATHDWASLSFYSALRARVGLQNLASYWPEQFGLMTPVGTVLVIGGLIALLHDESLRRYRSVAWTFALVVAAFFATSGKGYYPAGIYMPVVAAGAVVVERSWTPSRRRRLLTGIVATGLLLAPVFTPIVPESTAVDLGFTTANPDLGAMMGWHQIVTQMAGVYRQLPPAEQTSAVFLTRDYSEASALAYWRNQEHIPAAISGHNNEWWWGWAPAARADTVIAVGLSRTELRRWFGSITPAGTLTAAQGPIDPDQVGLPIWICQDRLAPWPTIWPALRLYA